MQKLFYNGDILTVESPGPAEAVLAEGGRIIAVGDLRSLSRMVGRQSEWIDLEGGALLAGFADCHSNFWAVVRAHAAAHSGGHIGMRAIRAAVRSAAEAYAARGFTVLHARGLTDEGLRALSHSDLPMPLWATVPLEEYETVKRTMASLRAPIYLRGISLDLDLRDDGGVATGETAYCDRALSFALRMAAAERVRPVMRAESEATAAQFLRVMRAVSRCCPDLTALRPILADARLLPPTVLERVRELGIVPCFAVDVLPRLGDDWMAACGMEQTARLAPLASARRAGLPYTLCEGLSGEEDVPDPIGMLTAAVERKTERGVVIGSEERTSVRDALRALTANVAWSCGAEREWGGIRAGMRADLIRLDRSPLSLPTKELRELRVVETFVGGESFWHEEGHNFSTHASRVPIVY
ncbi:MAG: amidohydrolase family protein [Clostridia bacterium]|nr:amidohydrolase family protein [Clostridia bacterium]